MKIVSAAEMREIDRSTSERFGVPSITLMENAGSAVARFVLSDYPQMERVSVVCGKGNNGGDGFVVARKLVEAGRAVRVLLLSDSEELRGDAAIMFQSMVAAFGECRAIDRARGECARLLRRGRDFCCGCDRGRNSRHRVSSAGQPTLYGRDQQDESRCGSDSRCRHSLRRRCRCHAASSRNCLYGEELY
jgi:hypothetical protein